MAEKTLKPGDKVSWDSSQGTIEGRVEKKLTGQMNKYKNSTLWNADNWSCEEGRIAMTDGIIVRNDFTGGADIRYVQKLAWKLARLHILPLGIVYHAPAAAPVEHRA